MTTYVALLRGINVGGVTLLMSDLVSLSENAGFTRSRTYIASGNLLLDSDLPEADVKDRLEAALNDHAGRSIGVMVRSAAEMAAVLAANPFADQPGNRVVAIFLDAAPDPDALTHARHQDTEVIAPGVRELYVHYPDGQGRSKLVIPAAAAGTARNMNTVAKLAAMAAS